MTLGSGWWERSVGPEKEISEYSIVLRNWRVSEGVWVVRRVVTEVSLRMRQGWSIGVDWC